MKSLIKYSMYMNKDKQQMLQEATKRVLKRLNGQKVPRLTLARMVNEETEKLMRESNPSSQQ